MHSRVFNTAAKRLASLVCLLLISFQAQATTYPEHLKPVGMTELKVLWWSVYEARLFNDVGEYQGIKPQVLLQLDYQRDIAKADLLAKTRELMDTEGVTAAQLQGWLQQLETLWPNVTEDDQLSFYIDEQGQGHFFFNRRWIGSIDDPLFGQAFLGIWLAEDSAYPKLSKALKGQSHD